MKKEAEDWCRNALIGCTECKKKLAQKLIERLEPFHLKRQELLKDPERIKKILKEGNEKAISVSSVTLKEVKNAIGI
jgi:tryptophanyl-tRNA synthetase